MSAEAESAHPWPPDGTELGGVLKITFQFSTLPVPLLIPVLVGETIYNMRAALDYLVYELARLDSGKIQNGTQFPIEGNKERFWEERRETYLKGVCDEHVAHIERLQPYEGCEWTKMLRDLSNPDKHRALTPIRPKPAFRMPQGHTDSASSDQPVKMNLEVTSFISFGDGPLVLPTLEKLQVEVANTLGFFKPEFE